MMSEVKAFLDASRLFRQQTNCYGPVLIVEDDYCIARMLSHMVKLQGLESKIVATVDDAITFIQENCDDIRCVILDLHLQGSDGEEVIHFIETQQSRVPYVVHTCDWDAAKEITKKYPRAAVYRKGDSITKLVEALGFNDSADCHAS